MDTRLRRAFLRLLGAAIVVLGVFVTATAVRRADQVVASGRAVLLGGELVDLYAGRDLTVSGHAELAGTAVALGDLIVDEGSLRIERDAIRVFAVGGGVVVGETAAIVFPESGALKYGTIRTGAAGSRETVLRDPEAVARYADMAPALASSSVCFDREPSTGIVRTTDGGLSLTGDGVSGLQVFTVDQAFVGEIEVARVPTHASVLINLIGDAAMISPRGADWNDIAAGTLVNVVSATSVDIDAERSLRLNTLVGSPESRVTINGDSLVGTVLSLGAVDLASTRFAHGPVEASLLPECAPADEPIEADDTTVATQPVAQTDSSVSTTTSTSSTTTTTVLSGEQPRGARAVPGAAFVLGGAATATQWWIGLPLTLLGAVLLGWGWIEQRRVERREWLARRRVTVRVLRRAGIRDRA